MLTRWLAFVRGMLRRQTIDREVEEELAFHLECEAARHESLGVPPDEARRLAALQLGGASVVRSNVADVRTTWMDVLAREIRVGIRALAGAPSFSVPAVVVLALGIAGTTTILSVLDGVLVRPLPYTGSEELVRIWSRNDERRIAFLSVSPADFEDWRGRAPVALRLAAYERPLALAPVADHEDPVTAMRVSPDLFAVLGVAPMFGRGFEPADVRGQVAVLSHGFWQRRFGAAGDVVGRTFSLGRETVLVIGVMPARFDVANATADVWLPLDTNVGIPARYAHTLRVLARTTGRADPVAVRRDLDVIAAQLAEERPVENTGWRVTVLPLFDTVVSPEVRRSLWITAGAVLSVLLLATTSVAGLVLVRSASRERELAVRVALGASRGSLVRLLLLECVVLATVGGALGLLAAVWGVSLIRDTGDVLIPRLDEVRVNGRVFGVTAAVSLVAALLAGVVPAWRSTRSLNDRLRHRGLASDPGGGRALPFLVVVELSAAVLLVVGAALLVQTVRNLHARPLGFDSEPLLSLTAVRPQGVEGEQVLAHVQRVLDRLASVPGVTAVAAGSALPFSGQNSGNTFEIEGQPVAGGALPDTDYRVVTPGYFDGLGVAMPRGRTFDDTDRSRGVIVISQTAAQRFWSARNPIGSRVKLGSSDWLTVVGVVDDVRYGALADLDDSVRPMMYVPQWQRPEVPLTFVVRASLAPASLVDDLRERWPTGQDLRLGRVETMTGLIRQASAAQRFSMSLVAMFAGTAVVLAVVALYGLLALLVGRRTREIGVRLALGATSWDVARVIVHRTLVLVGVGIVVGMVASGVMSRILQSALFGVSATDVRTYAAVALGFLVLAAAVSAIPIRRALKIDPVRIINVE
jgi:putative ABC transport system permease protein